VRRGPFRAGQQSPQPPGNGARSDASTALSAEAALLVVHGACSLAQFVTRHARPATRPMTDGSRGSPSSRGDGAYGHSSFERVAVAVDEPHVVDPGSRTTASPGRPGSRTAIRPPGPNSSASGRYMAWPMPCATMTSSRWFAFASMITWRSRVVQVRLAPVLEEVLAHVRRSSQVTYAINQVPAPAPFRSPRALPR